MEVNGDAYFKRTMTNLLVRKRKAELKRKWKRQKRIRELSWKDESRNIKEIVVEKLKSFSQLCAHNQKF